MPTASHLPPLPAGLGEVVAHRIAADGVREIVLLPEVDTLLGVPGFTRPDAILLPGRATALTALRRLLGRSFNLH